MDDDDLRDAPPPVIGSVAAGVAPLPFLAVYAVLFIVHGTVHPVIPPDVGSTKGDEALAGVIALALFVLGTVAVYWFLDGRRRWLFGICQAATLATSVDFIVDSTSGSPGVPILLAASSLIALLLAFVPAASWEHLRQAPPVWLPGRRSGRHAEPGA